MATRENLRRSTKGEALSERVRFAYFRLEVATDLFGDTDLRLWRVEPSTVRTWDRLDCSVTVPSSWAHSPIGRDYIGQAEASMSAGNVENVRSLIGLLRDVTFL